jgi:hypothetical protein
VADLAALEIAAALTEAVGDDASPLVAVHVEHSSNVDTVWPLLPSNFDAVPSDRNVGAVLAIAVGLAQYPSLLAQPTHGGGVHVSAPGVLSGLPFAEAQARCPQALPVGLLRGGVATFVPDPAEPVSADDGLIMLAGDRAAADARSAPPSTPPPPPPAALRTARAPAGAAAVLVLGWSPAGDDLVSELPDVSHLTVLAQIDVAPPGLPDGALRAGDPNDPTQIAAMIAALDPQIVILLGGANGGADGTGAHARAALGALKVSRIAERRDVTIVVEQYGSEQADRLRSADPRIRVISRAELVAHALLLSAIDRDTLIAQQALVTDDDLELTPVTYTGSEPVWLPAAYQGLLTQRSVILSLARGGRELTLADPAAGQIQPGDGLLLLTRSG